MRTRAPVTSAKSAVKTCRSLDFWGVDAI